MSRLLFGFTLAVAAALCVSAAAQASTASHNAQSMSHPQNLSTTYMTCTIVVQTGGFNGHRICIAVGGVQGNPIPTTAVFTVHEAPSPRYTIAWDNCPQTSPDGAQCYVSIGANEKITEHATVTDTQTGMHTRVQATAHYFM